MAALGAVSYEPVNAAYTTAGGNGVPQMMRYPEKATLTFKQGVPLVLNGGYVQEAAFSGAELVLGFAIEPAHNLSGDGVADGGYSEGTARNMPSSKITPFGAWFKDGKCGVYIANGQTVFSIPLKAGQTFSQALIAPGTLYGITKDNTSGFWYLDTADTSGNNAVAELLGVDPSAPNTVADGARVFFRITSSKRVFT